MPPIQFAINSYKARSLPLSAQNLVNFYAEKAPQDAKSQVVLYETPGIKNFAVAGNGPIRGMHVMAGVLYVISGCILYSVDALGKAAALGSICVNASAATGTTLPAEGSFTITGGTESLGVNQITSITVGGEEILGSPVNWTESDETFGTFLCLSIDSKIPFPPATHDNTTFSTVNEQSTPFGMDFSPGGTKMYVTGSGPFGVHQYSLETPWDITTALYDGIFFDLSAAGYGASAVFKVRFSNDGLRLYILSSDTSKDVLDEYPITEAFDLSTVGARTTSFSVNSEDSGPVGFDFSSDGTKFYMLGFFNEEIYQYSMTTPWSLATATYDSVSVAVPAGSSVVRGLRFSPDGSQLFFMINSNRTIVRYGLVTPWDLSTASDDGLSFDVVADVASAPTSIFINKHGLYVSTQTNAIYQYLFPPHGYACSLLLTTITITAAEGGPDGLPVVVTVAGDVTVDTPVTAIAGGFVMPFNGGNTTLDDSGCVSMSHNAATTPELAIVDGYNGWIYTTTGGLVRIDDEDFYAANTVSFQDQYFAFNRAGTGQFFLSNLNAGKVYTATDIATAEGHPDDLLAVIANHRELWLFGAETIEVWFNSGDADFPFERISGSFIERGCAAAFSVARIDNTLYWLGEDKVVYRASGYVPERISQHAMEAAMEKYAVVSDVCAFVYTMEGHKFYVMNFPTERVTWVYDAATGLWHQRESRDAVGIGLKRWRANAYAKAYGRHLVGDFETGQVGELDHDTFAEYGNTMQGLAAGPPIDNDRKRVFVSRLEMDVETGVGLTSGQGSDPQIELAWSDDGGHTWSARKPPRSMGKIGAYRQRLRWNRQGSTRNRIYQLIVSDPVKRSIVASNIAVRPGLS